MSSEKGQYFRTRWRQRIYKIRPSGDNPMQNWESGRNLNSWEGVGAGLIDAKAAEWLKRALSRQL